MSMPSPLINEIDGLAKDVYEKKADIKAKSYQLIRLIHGMGEKEISTEHYVIKTHATKGVSVIRIK